jgi:hypothetical protein
MSADTAPIDHWLTGARCAPEENALNFLVRKVVRGLLGGRRRTMKSTFSSLSMKSISFSFYKDGALFSTL